MTTSVMLKTTEVVTAEFIVQDKISTDSDGFSRAVKTTEVVTTVCPTPAEPVEARKPGCWQASWRCCWSAVSIDSWGLAMPSFTATEARAVLRATVVVQGHEEALFIHRRGRLEILIGSDHRLDRSDRRADGAPAIRDCWVRFFLFAIFGLGWRSVGGAPGWVGAMLLAINGYFIAFSRFVQYQSVVILATALVLLLLVGPAARAAAVSLTACCWRVPGALPAAHYDALAVAPPALLLLVALIIRSRQQTGERRQVVIGIGLAAFGAAVLASTMFRLSVPQLRRNCALLAG